jgi:hypothetical protein
MRYHVPLSQRSALEIRAQGEMYRQMATTARTPVAKRGLELLAVRWTAIADRRGPAANGLRPSLTVQEHAAD